mmetsp:Transcript_77606/g.231226  ORF Transcript_77606/g.231226 Transcript_77606/m.231226 type:complete len:244 (-) Transcript_77606:457-1188(-)
MSRRARASARTPGSHSSPRRIGGGSTSRRRRPQPALPRLQGGSRAAPAGTRPCRRRRGAWRRPGPAAGAMARPEAPPLLARAPPVSPRAPSHWNSLRSRTGPRSESRPLGAATVAPAAAPRARPSRNRRRPCASATPARPDSPAGSRTCASLALGLRGRSALRAAAPGLLLPGRRGHSRARQSPHRRQRARPLRPAAPTHGSAPRASRHAPRPRPPRERTVPTGRRDLQRGREPPSPRPGRRL